MPDDRIQRAQALYQQGDLENALALYRECLAEHDDALLQHSVAIILAQLGEYEEALQHINNALALTLSVAEFHSTRGNILMRLNRLTESLNAFQGAIRLKPDYAHAYSNLGNCYQRQQNWDFAENAYRKAIQLQPNFANAHYNLGLLLANKGAFTTAKTALEKTLELAPTFSPAIGQLAEIYLLQNQFDKAIKFYEKRIQLEPDHLDSYFKRGQAHLKLHQFEEAICCFEQVITLNSKHPEANHLLANAYLQNGDPDKALNYYFRQLEMDPQIESYYNIGVLLMDKNRHKEARHYLEHAAKMDPGYLPVHLNLGAIALNRHDIPNAIKHYQQALIINPDDQEISHILSALKQEDTPEKAPQAYLEHLFDHYAHYYDQHLTGALDYHVPEAIKDAIDLEMDLSSKKWRILDLGCGTGLCGPLFAPYKQSLMGIDISNNMIELAKQKHCYDQLIVADIEEAIQEQSQQDLIIAADVFAYIGNLEKIFSSVKKILAPSGIFAFSVEKTQKHPYELHSDIRYAHTKSYIESLIEKHQFKIVRFDNIILRKQRKQPVEGYLVLAQASIEKM